MSKAAGRRARDRRARRRADAVPACRRRLRARAPPSVPCRRAGPRQDDPGARDGSGRSRVPGGGRLPGLAQAELAARDRDLAAGPYRRSPSRAAPARTSKARTSSFSTTRSPPRTSRRSGELAPRALILDESHYVKNPVAVQHQGRARAGREPGARRAPPGAHRHAGRQPSGRAGAAAPRARTAWASTGRWRASGADTRRPGPGESFTRAFGAPAFSGGGRRTF